MTTKTRSMFATTLVALCLPAAAAQAHVTLQPAQAPAGGFARLDVRVPNEDDANATRKVELQMPPGFASARYEPVPGWRVAVSMREPDAPAQGGEDAPSEEVDTITFTAQTASAGIRPGEFQDFGISVRLPERPTGTTLSFPALQTYAGGRVVRWIGAPGSDEPAAQVTLTAAVDDPGAHGDETAATEPAASAADDGGDGLAIAALIVGGLGLIAGTAGLLVARRVRAT
ncbi:MAG: YcnI family protein [Solirubrobacteraceae bacterium]|nr:YcnI family protein [Solirubrobacteraceae bacterium]